jgi:glyoxylase-like metal-dependent hydrolase (beta-lactamase superfamily II)
MKIAPGVYSMGVSKGFNVHAFLLDDGDGLTLIDTLFDAGGQVILDELEAMGKSVDDIKRIVLTHGHRSHLGGAADLKRMSGAPVYSHEWEADIISGDRKAQTVSWWPQDPLNTYHYQLGNNLAITNHPPCEVDHFLRGGEQLGPVQVVHTPGHSPGHLAFWWPETHVLITGDAVVTSPRFMAGWPGFVLNARQHAESVHRLAEFDAEILAVGHGEPILADGAARLRALLA